jgi:hypothetical protein
MRSEPPHNFGKRIISIPTEEWKLSYLAGIIDGEGTVSLERSPNGRFLVCPTVQIANSSPALFDWIEREFKGCRRHKRGRTYKKPMFQWRVRRTRDVLALLQAVLPFLTIKKENALIVITSCEKRLRERGEEF